METNTELQEFLMDMALEVVSYDKEWALKQIWYLTSQYNYTEQTFVKIRETLGIEALSKINLATDEKQ